MKANGLLSFASLNENYNSQNILYGEIWILSNDIGKCKLRIINLNKIIFISYIAIQKYYV